MNKIYTQEVDSCYMCPGIRFREKDNNEYCSVHLDKRDIIEIYFIPPWCPLEDVCLGKNHESIKKASS